VGYFAFPWGCRFMTTVGGISILEKTYY